MKHTIKIIITLTFVISIFSIFFYNKFYGFEYEDSFINPSVSSDNNYFQKIINFRTAEFSNYINQKGHNLKLYPGHYIPYSFYLYSIKKIFNCDPYLIHKIGNLILLSLSMLTILKYSKDRINYKIIFIISLISSLPFLYIINSALIENLSFFIGIFLITYIRYNTDINTDTYKKILAVFIILLLTLVKRENLIYLLTLPLFITQKDLKNHKILLTFITFISLQIIINPFFTEGIEASSLQKPTFSIYYLLFQLPTYLKSMISIKGFLIILLNLFYIKTNTKSLYIFFIWFLFIIFYSIHYRSKYAIESHTISIMETYRYLINTLPLFYGIIIFSTTRNFKPYTSTIQITSLMISSLFLINTISIFKDFVLDEYYNYHKVDELIAEESKSNKINIYDNFVLISILNLRDKNVNIYELKDFPKIKNEKNTFIINRFNEVNLKNIKNLTEIKKLSTKETKVYSFKQTP